MSNENAMIWLKIVLVSLKTLESIKECFKQFFERKLIITWLNNISFLINNFYSYNVSNSSLFSF